MNGTVRNIDSIRGVVIGTVAGAAFWAALAGVLLVVFG